MSTVAFLFTDGVEQVELTHPRDAVRDAGHEAVMLTLEPGEIRGYDGIEPADAFTAERAVADADPGDFDALVLPGGVANGDFLRGDEQAVAFVRDFLQTGKPVAVICHAPWVLVEAGACEGRRLTSYPTLRTDIRNAGGEWVDEEVVVDGNLITSRNPGDLDAFSGALVEALQRVTA